MLAIKDGRVLTAAHKEYDKATLLIEDGRIIALGEDLAIPSEAKVIDAQGCWVCPGLIDAHTHIGVWGEPNTRGGISDGNETAAEPATPQVRALDAFNICDPGIAAAREAGFTACCTLPGSGNVVGGTGFAYKLCPRETVDQMMIPGTEVMKFALGENPRFNYGTKGKSPKTRMGVGAVLRQTLFEAKIYSDQLLEAQNDPEKKPPTPNFRLEALVPVVRGEMLCRIHCHRADDIATAIRIAKEFGLRYSLEHATEGFKLPDILATEGVFCVIGPLNMGPAKQEVWECNFGTPGVLANAGIKICLTQDTGVMTKLLPTFIGLAIAEGLSHKAALEAVTINAARLLGIDSMTGSLEVGKAADIAIFNGDPFSNYTKCLHTIIEGQVFSHS